MSEATIDQYIADLAQATKATGLSLISQNENASNVYHGFIGNRKVVIKISLEKKIAQNLNREIVLLRKLRHPDIVKYISHGRFRTRQGKAVRYLIEEFIEGKTLAQIIDETNGQGIPWQTAVQYMIPICCALKKLHCAKRMYVDLKPDNMIINKDGKLKFIDLGAVKKQPYTPNGIVLGAPAYISLDWVICPLVDARSDIYSLGIVLFEMLTGKVPFHEEVTKEEKTKDNDSLFGLFMKYHTTLSRPPIPHVPEKLEQIYKKLMNPWMPARYQRIGEVLSDLHKVS